MILARLTKSLFAVCLFSFVSIQYCTADFAITAINSGKEYGNGGDNHVVGWKFSISQSIEITHLGMFDSAPSGGSRGDGLLVDHDVGIYSDSGTLLFSQVIDNASSTLIGDFRYEAVSSPLVLGSGTYVIAAFMPDNGDDYLLDETTGTPNDYNFSPMINYQSARFLLSQSGLVFPTGELTFAPYTEGFIGPSFQFSAVPEPTTVALIVTSAVCFGLRRARENKQLRSTIT
jgi:hypothetical protein